MDNLKYIKAVPMTNARSIVYAFQFTEKDFHFAPSFVPGLGRPRVLAWRMYGEIYFIFPNEWLVWMPLSVEFCFLSDSDFRNKYTPYEDLPPNIKAFADKHPSYDEWVEHCDKIQTAPKQ